MIKTILNSNFEVPEDGFYQVVPRGEFPIKYMGKRLVQVVDDKALAAMLNRFNSLASQENFGGVLIDFDHFSDDTDKPSEAAGWAMALENRADGLYAQIRWSDIGEQAVRGGRYRYISPSWFPENCETLSNRRVRPLSVHRWGVTNDHNMIGMKPLSNRREDVAGATDPDLAVNAKQKGTGMDYKAMLLQELGLPPEATDEQIQAKCGKAKIALEESKGEVVAMKNRAEAAETKVVEFEKRELEAQVENDLETHKDVIQNREDMKKQLMSNRAGTLVVLQSLKKPDAKPGSPMMNRKDAKQPEGDADIARAKERDEYIDQVSMKNRCATRAQAWAIAERERPELFQ